jgi:hypothetical protein
MLIVFSVGVLSLQVFWKSEEFKNGPNFWKVPNFPKVNHFLGYRCHAIPGIIQIATSSFTGKL